jgi:hypothetical protein
MGFLDDEFGDEEIGDGVSHAVSFNFGSGDGDNHPDVCHCLAMLTGRDGPDFGDIAGDRDLGTTSFNGFKLHIKEELQELHLDAIAALPIVEGTNVSERFMQTRRWIDDISSYDSVEKCGARELKSAPFTAAEVRQLVDAGQAVEIPREEHWRVRGGCRMFKVPEVLKKRFRVIKWPERANDALGKETLLSDPPIDLSNKRDAIALATKGSHIAAVDAKAFYDQFPLSKDVSYLFCFRHRRHVYRLTRLPTGLRQAVDVAATAMQMLLSFERRTHVETCIDNVIFVGSKEDVERDLSTFIARCKATNVQLNEIDIHQYEQSQVQSLVRTRNDVLGVDVDVGRQEVRLLEKSLVKLRRSWEHRESWSWRNFAAHMGLLYWSLGVLEVPMADYFPLLRFVSHAGRILQEDDSKWDEPADVWPTAWQPLRAWTSLMLENKPRRVETPRDPDWYVCTDACADGWGYVALELRTGAVRCHGERWNWQLKRQFGSTLRHSTVSESVAIKCAVCHLFQASTSGSTTIRIGTDSMTARAAYRRGYHPQSPNINAVVRELRKTLGTRVKIEEVVHVAGQDNIHADALSRQLVSASALDGNEVAASLRRGMGGCGHIVH